MTTAFEGGGQEGVHDIDGLGHPRRAAAGMVEPTAIFMTRVYRGRIAPGCPGRAPRYARQLHAHRPHHTGHRGGRPGHQSPGRWREPRRSPRTGRSDGRCRAGGHPGLRRGSPRGHRPRGEQLVGRTQSLRVVNPLGWDYLNPGVPVAAKLGMEPGQIMVSTTGGNNPQSMVNATSLAIGRGEIEVAVIVGPTASTPGRWPADIPIDQCSRGPCKPADIEPPVVFGNNRRGTTEAEEERGLDLPIHVFPLFENALRAAAGRSLPDHRHRIGALWSRFADVAATNPHAWLPTARTPEEIVTPSATNRMIASPYTTLLTANMQVDQGAAIVLCSAEAARSAGIPPERWVFPRAGADADDHWFLSHRLDFHSSRPSACAGRPCWPSAGTTIDEVAHVDLYSCFPRRWPSPPGARAPPRRPGSLPHRDRAG